MKMSDDVVELVSLINRLSWVDKCFMDDTTDKETRDERETALKNLLNFWRGK